jgi:hypothetical protein
MKAIGVVFTLVGLTLTVAAAVLTWSTVSFLDDAEQVTGQVVGFERSRDTDNRRDVFRPVVRFTDEDGKAHTFVSSTASNPPDYVMGETVSVVMRPQEPGSARLDTFADRWLIPAILAGVGMVFLLIGGFLVARLLAARARRSRLQERGRRVEATVVGVQVNTKVRVQRRHPVALLARWQDPLTGRTWDFRSDDLWTDPTPALQATTIGVLVDPDDPRRYWVDTSALSGR